MKNKQQWKEGTVQEFLGLSDADMVALETKVALTFTPNSITQLFSEAPHE